MEACADHSGLGLEEGKCIYQSLVDITSLILYNKVLIVRDSPVHHHDYQEEHTQPLPGPEA